MLTRKKIIIRSKFVYKFSLTARRGKFFSIQVNLISRHDVLAYTKKHELDVLKCISNNDFLIDCSSCHVTYAFQSESTLYSCLNVKELFARSRRKIWRLSDCNWTRLQLQLQLDSKWLSARLRTKWFWVQIQLQSLNSFLTQLILKLCRTDKKINFFAKEMSHRMSVVFTPSFSLQILRQTTDKWFTSRWICNLYQCGNRRFRFHQS